MTAILLTSSETSLTAKFNNFLIAVLFPDPTYAIPKDIQAPYLKIAFFSAESYSIKVSAAYSLP